MQSSIIKPATYAGWNVDDWAIAYAWYVDFRKQHERKKFEPLNYSRKSLMGMKRTFNIRFSKRPTFIQLVPGEKEKYIERGKHWAAGMFLLVTLDEGTES